MSDNMDGWIEKHIVVSHWPPSEPEPKPKVKARPLTGLPAMMHDLMEAADRHDRVSGRVTTSEGKSSRTEVNPQHLSAGMAGCSRYDVLNRRATND